MEQQQNPETSLQAASAQESASMQDNTNVLRRHIKEEPMKAKLAKHRIWMDSIPHEYPMPYTPYKIGVYIRYYNQTRYENYLEKHIQQYMDDIALCPRWMLVDFYVDRGQSAPHMEYSKEWCRLLEDCFTGKVDLIVTQKVSNVSSDWREMAFIARMLAAQERPIGIYSSPRISLRWRRTTSRICGIRASYLLAGRSSRRTNWMN